MRPTCRDDLVDRAVGEQLAVEDVGEAMAALGFIHVVRGDEERQALAGELMDLLPEIAARLRIHAGGRLVEEQQLRLVDQARGQREPLLPAAGELPGELRLAAGQAESLDALAHRLRGGLARRTCARRNRGSPRCSGPRRS